MFHAKSVVEETAMTPAPPVPLDTPHQRLRFAREQAGFARASDAARAMGIGEPTYLGHENGSRGLSRAAARYARFFHVSLDWLIGGRGEFHLAGSEARLAATPGPATGLSEPPPPMPPMPAPPRNAEVGGPARFAAAIPAYGQAVGGKDGEFILNGNRIVDILAPPSLQGVPDAYAVYVVGDSMEPRYFAGEAVFVNPRLPVRRGDFVVAQIAAEEGEPPHAYIKRFVAREARVLRLEQFNPKKTLEFPVGRVISVHRIIMGGDG
jgi:phage repressor protein C with HTH and peptisase S24 domain